MDSGKGIPVKRGISRLVAFAIASHHSPSSADILLSSTYRSPERPFSLPPCDPLQRLLHLIHLLHPPFHQHLQPLGTHHRLLDDLFLHNLPHRPRQVLLQSLFNTFPVPPERTLRFCPSADGPSEGYHPAQQPEPRRRRCIDQFQRHRGGP